MRVPGKSLILPAKFYNALYDDGDAEAHFASAAKVRAGVSQMQVLPSISTPSEMYSSAEYENKHNTTLMYRAGLYGGP